MYDVAVGIAQHTASHTFCISRNALSNNEKNIYYNKHVNELHSCLGSSMMIVHLCRLYVSMTGRTVGVFTAASDKQMSHVLHYDITKATV